MKDRNVTRSGFRWNDDGWLLAIKNLKFEAWRDVCFKPRTHCIAA